jgi:iron complex outermembrane receptor protein
MRALDGNKNPRSDSRRHRVGFWVMLILGGSLLPALCLADNTGTGSADADSTSNADTSQGLSEITITAEKYSSTIQETPISISALSGADLAAAGISSVEDVTRTIPGLSMRSSGPGQSEYEARGLASNGGSSPTVGFYLDETPLSPPTLAQVGKVVIDPDLYDVTRIEVLRGPQGTLYGSGSMGGTIKIITNQPKLDTFEGSAQGNLSGTEGGGLNGGGSAMLNLPLGDLIAVRVVGTETYRSGWIDRVVLNPFPPDTNLGASPPFVRGNVLAAPVQYVDKHANTEFLDGGRVSVLFKPTDTLSIVAMAMEQHMSMGAYDEFDSPPGAHYLSRYEPFDIPEPISDTIHIENLTITADLGFADLTSATGYWDRQETQQQDGSESISLTNGSSATGGPFFSDYIPSPYQENDYTHQLSQEVRLTSSNSDRLHWTVGGFWSELNSTWNEYGDSPENAGPLNPPGVFYDSWNPYRMEQGALFIDGSFKFTEQWKFSTGVRWYDYKSRQFELEWGSDAPYPYPPGAPGGATQSANRVSNSGFNPRFNLSYAPSPDLDTYLSMARGFRPGGVNQTFPPPDQPPHCQLAPLTFNSDSVWNYELGEKARFFGNRLSINSDIYYIKWYGVPQTPLLSCGYEYITNAGDGRSFGPELEIEAKLSDEWTFSANAAYTDADITHVYPTYQFFLQNYQPGGVGTCEPTATVCKQPILNVPKETGNAALVYSTQVLDGHTLTARVSDAFVGSVVDEAYYFGIKLPPYNIANARVALTGDKWSAGLFVNNLTNRIAEISSNNTSFQFNIPQVIRYSTNQPRTFGTQIDYRF